MKKGAPLSLVALLSLLSFLTPPAPPRATAAAGLDWQLPVTTLRLETALGSAEDPDEETLEPSSERVTASLRLREEADPAVFGITLRGSWKDYLLQSGDYSYVELEQDGSIRLEDWVKLGYALAAKDLAYPQPDSQGLSKDSLALKAATSVAFTIVKGTSLEGNIAGRWELAENDAQSRQAYVLTTSLSSRLGEWLFGARYRGELRAPMGSESGVTFSVYHTGGITLEWDPNP